MKYLNKDFNAKGDGIADDTQALKAGAKYVAANGGTLVLDGVYRTTSTISISGVTKNFTLLGQGPATKVLADFYARANVFNMMDLNGCTLKDFTVEGKEGAKAQPAHPIALGRPQNCVLDRVHVKRFTGTGILFTRDPVEDSESVNNHTIRCVVDGAGVGGNGVNFSSMTDSTMIDCHIYNLDLNNSPVYGLQLKNNSRRCQIRGGVVDGALAGVAFGSEGATKNTHHHVSGVLVRNCPIGFIASKTYNSDVSLQIDMAGKSNSEYPVKIISGCDALHVEASVYEMASGDIPVYMGSSNCSVTLRLDKPVSTMSTRVGPGQSSSITV